MENLEKVRYVTSNFNRLKGLNMTLMGVVVAITGLWTNRHQGDLSLLIILVVAFVPLQLLLNRYYRKTFGQVSRTQKDLRGEWIANILGGVLGLAAFIADTTGVLPFSAVGLLFAAMFVWEYVWVNRTFTEKRRSYYLVFAIIIVLVSLLPLFGLGTLWRTLGFADPIFGVMTIVGLLLIVAGLLDHVFLMKAFPPQKEFHNGELV